LTIQHYFSRIDERIVHSKADRSVAVASAGSARPVSSIAFDWTMALLAVLLAGGIYLDGWAHNHGLVDESFFTPWHAALYGGMALNGLVLGALAVRNRLRGYAVRCSLTFGYGLALCGVVLFTIGGAFDLVWHSLFGIEVGIDALISPSHLVLAVAAALILSAPLRSVAAQYNVATGGWARVAPAVLSALAVMLELAFFMQYAQPIGDGSTAKSLQRDRSTPIVPMLFSSDAGGLSTKRVPVPARLDVCCISFSPDGRHIAYRGQPPGVDRRDAPVSAIYVADADGTHARAITRSGRHDTAPAWSPRGDRIAYLSAPAGTAGDFALKVVAPDGSGVHTIVSGTTRMFAPSWSPEGTKLAYGSRNGTVAQIATVALADPSPRWIGATAGGSMPSWLKDGRIAFVRPDGTIAIVDPRTDLVQPLAFKGTSPKASADGTKLAFVTDDAGGGQLVVSSGAKMVQVSQMSGLAVQSFSWGPPDSLYFTVMGRPDPVHRSIGKSLGEAANVIQSVTLCGLLLLCIRRWRVPVGALTLVLTCYAIALATQEDLYFAILPAAATGLLIDAILAFMGDRARHGVGFYAVAFALPALFFATYEVAAIAAGGGPGWPPNMLFGSPIIAGFAGLLVAFCYEPPLPECGSLSRG
jgi:hypothetical protein